MKLTYFGTAAAEGWPALFCNCPACVSAREKGGRSIRTRSQALVNDDLLLDFPPDTYLHVLNYGLNLDPVKDVLITHGHEDHLYVEDLACRMQGFVAPENRSPWKLGLWGSPWVRALYEQNLRERFSTGLPEVVEMKDLTEYVPARVGRYTVHPMLADHAQYAKCYIYAVEDGEGGQLLYAHDTGCLREDCWDYLKKAGLRFKLVSLDCTCGTLDSSRNHMGLVNAASVKERLLAEGLANAGTTFIVNHFSHNGIWRNHDEMSAAAAAYGMLVSYDGMSVEV